MADGSPFGGLAAAPARPIVLDSDSPGSQHAAGQADLPAAPPAADDCSPSGSSSSDGEGEAETHATSVARIINDMGSEEVSTKRRVYLGTFSHVLPETAEIQGLCDPSALSREDVAGYVRDAWDNPCASRAGRPRGSAQAELTPASLVDKLIVFRELHASGGVHFHVAIKLSRSMRLLPAKQTLRERYQLASHWSCSHTQLYSAVRYCHIPSAKKADVDPEPFQWTADSRALDLFAESQGPWQATAWKRRREGEAKAVAAGQKKQRGKAFTKLDLTAIILGQGLETKAAVLEYTQNHGTHAMQAFIHQHQRKVKEYLEDAAEWSAARAAAVLERESGLGSVVPRGGRPVPAR